MIKTILLQFLPTMYFLLFFISCVSSQVLINPTHNGVPIERRCVSCTTVESGVYTKTDSSGTPTATFGCSDGPAESYFCENPSEISTAAVTPDPNSICKSVQYPITCFSADAVAIWGDSRTDPCGLTVPTVNYASGALRDWFPEDYATIGYRSTFMPKSPKSETCGSPDISAFYGGGVWQSLLYYTRYTIARPGSFTDRSNPATYESMPVYQHNNDKLFLYVGINDDPWLDATLAGAISKKEAHRHLYTYLSTHKAPTLRNQPFQLRYSFQTYKYTSAEDQLFHTTVANYLNCPAGPSPYLRLNTLHPSTTAESCAMSYGYWENIRGRPQVNIFTALQPPGGSLITLSRLSTPDAVLIMYAAYGSQAELAYYPFVMFPTMDRRGHQLYGVMSFMEQSADGTNWDLVRHTLHPQLHSSYDDGDYDAVLTGSYTHHICNRPITGNQQDYCYIPVGPDPGYKFLRQVTLIAAGSSNVHADFTRGSLLGFLGFLSSKSFFTAQSEGPVTLYVTPSLHPTDDITDMGYEVCEEVPNCNYIPSSYGNLYPSTDGYDRAHGSATVRRHMSTRVMPVIYGCNAIVDDPVDSFLNTPQPTPGRCLRLKSSPDRSTCYDVTSSSHTSAVPFVETDSLQSSVSYHKSGFKLTVRSDPSIGNYPTPLSAIGPFTPTSLSPTAFIYDSPVQGSFQFGNLYISSSLKCESGAPAGPLPLRTSCTCHEYPLSSTACLCSDNKAYMATGTLPEDVTFSYPAFFTPVAIPINYTLVNNRISYDTGVYTNVNVKCETFLCSNNPVCLAHLSTTPSQEFCFNLVRILQSTLSNLRQSTTTADLSVANYLSKHAIPPTTPLASAPPLPGVSSSSSSVPPSAQDLRSYYDTQRSATLSSTFRRPNQYNYHNPYTTPAEAFGLAIIPAVGVGILTEKVNALAAGYDHVIQYLGGIRDAFLDLRDNVVSGFNTIYNIASQLASSHNQLVEDVNKNARVQDGINIQFAEAINSIGNLATDNARRIRLNELIQARSSTLVAQASAIMVTAADHAARGREFALRVDACSDHSSASAPLCARSSGHLVSSSVRKVGTVSILDTLVLQPTKSRYVYGTPEFCYKGLHFVSHSKYIFVLDGNQLKATQRHRYSLEEISASNSEVLPRCSDPSLVVTDFTPSVALVPVSATFMVAPVADFANISVASLPQSNATVDITPLLNQLQNTTAAISNITIQPFDPLGFGVSNSINAIYISLIVLAVLLLLALILGGAAYAYMKHSPTQQALDSIRSSMSPGALYNRFS